MSSAIDSLPHIDDHPIVVESRVNHEKNVNALQDVEAQINEANEMLANYSFDRDTGTLVTGSPAAVAERQAMTALAGKLATGEVDVDAIPAEATETIRAKYQRLQRVRRPLHEAVKLAERSHLNTQSLANKEAAASIRDEYASHVRKVVDAGLALRQALLDAERFMCAVENKGYSSVFSSHLRSIRGMWHVSTDAASPDNFILFAREMQAYGLLPATKK